MDYHGLIARIKAAERREGQRLRLYIHRDEMPSLLRSLMALKNAAHGRNGERARVYADLQRMHGIAAEMQREIDGLKLQLQAAKNQRPLPLAPDFSMQDDWQKAVFEAQRQRQVMRERC